MALLDEQGSPAHEMKPGTSLTLAVTLDADEPLADPVLGVGIDTPLGQSIFGTNTKLLGQRLPPVHGRATFHFRLNDLRLGEGSYMVHGAVADQAGIELHRLRDAASFAVRADGATVGHVWADVEFRSVSR
ncbi:Wzt carbohydrate-binding domain-containing protein [Cellulomonas sp. ATA003]|uniref:Wzt carbohydrate-binding domain-containing protein n=1 Tax=Cellulomonas sp. ATA003 TaxID=3073064 RepID=UPI002873C179|nr:Wzt carbohydrate-binding domain-containing protein [Cellulomonas sp. ATA003]WNB86310.1 Wzt carbohydrate-binding domain-containing protein [Cellulomonas sp. ATA003]